MNSILPFVGNMRWCEGALLMIEVANQNGPRQFGLGVKIIYIDTLLPAQSRKLRFT